MTDASARFPRSPRTLFALVATTVVVAIASISCSDGASLTTTNATRDVGDVIVVATPQDGSSATTTTDPPSRPVGLVPTASRDDLRREARAMPADVRVHPDDEGLLLVRYHGGPDPCHGARVAVDEGPATVRILLFVGTPPEGEATACAAIAVEREVAVRLDRPLGTRDLDWR